LKPKGVGRLADLGERLKQSTGIETNKKLGITIPCLLTMLSQNNNQIET
jgi:hypothetical protein